MQGLMCKCEAFCLSIYFFGQPCAVPCHLGKMDQIPVLFFFFLVGCGVCFFAPWSGRLIKEWQRLAQKSPIQISKKQMQQDRQTFTDS